MGTPSSTRRQPWSTARLSCSRASKIVEGSRTSPSRAPRTASTAGRSHPSLCSHRMTGSRAKNGDSRTRASSGSTSSSRWVITCTAYGPAGPAVFLATTEDFRTVERHGIVGAPRTRTPRCYRSGSTAAGCSSTVPRPSSAAPAARSSSRALPTWLAGAPPNRSWNHAPAPGGTRCGSASDRRRSAPSTAGCSSTTASRRPSPAASIEWVSHCSTSRSRPAFCDGCPTGSSRRSRRTSEQATSRTSSSPAAFSMTRAATSFGSTTAPPTARSALRPHDFATSSRPSSLHQRDA